MTDRPIDALDSSLAAATPALSPTDARLAVAIYRALASGRPVRLEDAAAVAELPLGAATATIEAWPAVYWDQDQIVGFWGLALTAMPHRLRVGDVALYAWCAWDPLFLARILGDINVATEDPLTGDTITYRVDSTGGIAQLSHPGSVLSFRTPDRPWDGEVQATFCHYVMHFTSDESALLWVAERPGTFVLALHDGVELAHRHVDRAFAEALGGTRR